MTDECSMKATFGGFVPQSDLSDCAECGHVASDHGTWTDECQVNGCDCPCFIEQDEADA